MLGSSVVAAFLWAVAVAATVWILVPAFAFAFGVGRIETQVLPDVGPPTLPGDDPPALPVLAQLGELGFRVAGRTVQSGRFALPTHWNWRQLGTTLWLVSPDGRTYATLYRLVSDEPPRLAMITMFDDGGFVRTDCPGANAKEAWRPHYWRIDLRGVSAETLVAKHQEQVEAFAREHRTRPRAATIAVLTAASDAAEHPVARKIAASGYGLVMAFVPALFFVGAAFGQLGGIRSSMAALGVCAMAGFYAVLRWVVHGPLLNRIARRTHTQDLSGEPDDIAPDGTILTPGKNERWVRLLAVPGALLAGFWGVMMLGSLVRVFGQRGPVSAVFPLLVFAVFVYVTTCFIGRARGKVVLRRRGHRDPRQIWFPLLMVPLFFDSWTDPSKTHFHSSFTVAIALSLVLGLAGWMLEKRRG